MVAGVWLMLVVCLVGEWGRHCGKIINPIYHTSNMIIRL